MSSSTPVAGPSLSPCSQWITADDVAAFTQIGANPNPEALERIAAEAGDALFEISGRQFTGLCDRTVRPTRDRCGCFGSISAGLGPWYWTSAWYGGGAAWGWQNECGDTFGCDPMSRIRLAGYPVRDIVRVTIDGQIVDPAGYRLDEWRYLTRLDDPGPPFVNRYWPGCQNMSLNADQPGTFEVMYRHGVDPPQLGKDAACQLAAQLYTTAFGQSSQQLPAGVTSVTRQGVKVDRGVLANWLEKGKPTGLVYVDSFLRAYWPSVAQRRPAVFSPDLQTFARRMGT